MHQKQELFVKKTDELFKQLTSELLIHHAALMKVITDILNDEVKKQSTGIAEFQWNNPKENLKVPTP